MHVHYWWTASHTQLHGVASLWLCSFVLYLFIFSNAHVPLLVSDNVFFELNDKYEHYTGNQNYDTFLIIFFFNFMFTFSFIYSNKTAILIVLQHLLNNSTIFFLQYSDCLFIFLSSLHLVSANKPHLISFFFCHGPIVCKDASKASVFKLNHCSVALIKGIVEYRW